jgi:flagellar hook-length control protein FliK
MSDAALSVASAAPASPLASVLSGASHDSSAAKSATAQAVDPFSALLASAAVKKTDLATTAASTDPVKARVATPVTPSAALPSTAAASQLAVAAMAATDPTALPVAKSDKDDDDKSASKDEHGDPLADAIASGATAVLAIAPVIVPPVQSAVAADAPVKSTTDKITASAASAHPGLRFKTGPQSATDAAHDATTTTAGARDASSSPQSQTPQANAAASVDAVAALPDAVKAAIAALQQGDSESPQSDPASIKAAAAAVAAKAQIQAVQTAPQQQAAQSPPAASRRSTEMAAPRSASTTRKRADSAAAEAAPVGLTQRSVDTTAASNKAISGPASAKGDAVVQQTLSIAKDGAWLDSLARDIAGSANNTGNLQFKLEPQNLGSLTVAISQSDDGASIRMTADNETTRNILLDAQPKLMAEARAQGMKISDSQVDVSKDQTQNQGSSQDMSRWAQNSAGQNGTAQNGQNRQSSPGHQPFVSNLARNTDADSESPDRDSDALYA